MTRRSTRRGSSVPTAATRHGPFTASVTHHCGSEAHAEKAATRFEDPESKLRVFRALKDADGLDRVRLGDLDPAYLCFPQSRLRVARAWELLRERP